MRVRDWLLGTPDGLRESDALARALRAAEATTDSATRATQLGVAKARFDELAVMRRHPSIRVEGLPIAAMKIRDLESMIAGATAAGLLSQPEPARSVIVCKVCDKGELVRRVVPRLSPTLSVIRHDLVDPLGVRLARWHGDHWCFAHESRQ